MSAADLRSSKPVGLAAVVDRLLPGPDSRLEDLSAELHTWLTGIRENKAGRKVFTVLRGNDWLGHPAHPLMVAVPIGGYVISAWYDLRSGSSADRQHHKAADSALLFGLTTALPAVATDAAQFLDTAGTSRRETTVHAAVNTVTTVLYVASYVLRKIGARSAGRRLAVVALTTVGVSGFLGGDLAYRHGIGVQAGATTS